MYYGGKLTDLLWLNFLFTICSIPLITIGASYTAMHAVLLKIYRDDGSSVTKDFFRAFRKNFKQSTILWLIYLVVGFFLFVDYRMISVMDEVGIVFRICLWVGLFIYSISLSWAFILQSRYENTVKVTIRNSFMIGVGHIGKTLLMMVMLFLPIFLILLWERTVPLVLLLGFTAPGILQTMLYQKVFQKLEETITESQEI